MKVELREVGYVGFLKGKMLYYREIGETRWPISASPVLNVEQHYLGTRISLLNGMVIDPDDYDLWEMYLEADGDED